eukprot:SAG22_NODE_48_length_24654_cov_4.406394_6_plen_228_part_00
MPGSFPPPPDPVKYISAQAVAAGVGMAAAPKAYVAPGARGGGMAGGGSKGRSLVGAFPCGPTAEGTAFLCCSLPFVVVPLMQAELSGESGSSAGKVAYRRPGAGGVVGASEAEKPKSKSAAKNAKKKAAAKAKAEAAKAGGGDGGGGAAPAPAPSPAPSNGGGGGSGGGEPVGEATVLSFKGSDHCLSFCFSAFLCGSTALTADTCCNQTRRRRPRGSTRSSERSRA